MTPPPGRRYLGAGSSLLLLFGVVLIHGPVVIYGASPLDLDLTLGQLLRLLLPALGVAVVLGLLPLRFLSESGSRFYRAVLLALAAAVWVGGSFLPSHSGALDGNAQALSAGGLPVALQTALWLATFAAALALGLRQAKAAETFALVLNLGLMAASAAAVVRDAKPPSALSVGELQRARLGRLSPEANVLIVLLDALQSDVFHEVVQSTPGWAERFDGFTYYKNALGVAPTTYLSMPAIYAGLQHQPGDSIRELERQASDSSFLRQLAEGGADVVHANPYGLVCPREALCVRSKSMQLGALRQLLAEGAQLVDLSLFRALPLPLARLVYGDGRWWLVRWTDGGTTHSVSENHFFADLVDGLHVEGGGRVVKLIRLTSTHKPVDIDERCKPRRAARALSRRAYRVQARCALEPFVALLARLERLGVYDETAILLISDHGVPCCLSTRYVDDPAARGRPWTILAGSASPTFAFKPFGSRGALATSLAPVQLIDLGATVCALVPGCQTANGRDVRTVAEDEVRVREFVTYRWGKGFRGRDTLPELRHLVVVGKPYERSSWTNLTAADEASSEQPAQSRRGRARDRPRRAQPG